MTIEKLTEADRRKLDHTENYAGRKALRIIDAQAVALAEARASIGAYESAEQRMSTELSDALEALAEARAECERLRAQAESWERGHDYAWAQKTAAEAREAAAEAERDAWEKEVNNIGKLTAEERGSARRAAVILVFLGFVGGLIAGLASAPTSASNAAETIRVCDASVRHCDAVDSWEVVK